MILVPWLELPLSTYVIMAFMQVSLSDADDELVIKHVWDLRRRLQAE